MPVELLRCRVCESEYPAVANGICVRCFGPLEPVYDWDALAATVSRGADRGGAVLALALRRPAARDPLPSDAASGPGLTPLVPAPRLASRARRRRGLAQARPREPDPLVQGPRRRRRRRQGAPSSASRRSPATSTGNLANAVAARAAAEGLAGRDLLPRRARAGEDARHDRLRGDACTGCAAATTTARAWSASSPARSTGRSSTSTSAPTTPRDRRRSRSRSPSSSAGRPPTRSSRRSPRARCSPSSGRDSSSSGGSGWSAARSPRLYGGQADGCSPVATRFRRERRVSPVRPEHGRALARDRQPGRRRPRGRDRARLGRRDLRGARGRGRREHGAARRDSPASSARRRPGVTIGALRARPPWRDRRQRPRRRARHRHRAEDAAGGRAGDSGSIVEIDADARRAARRARGDA